MRGRLIDLAVSMNGRQRVTLELNGDFKAAFDMLKDADLDIDIKKHRNRRSKSANAYFHLLVGKIAEVRGLGIEEVKRQLVIEYGTLAKDKDGTTVGFKLPASVDVESIYPYVRCFDTRTEGGKEFRCYLVFKGTHEMNTSEMCRLIDGTIIEAQKLGIETDTPAELEKFKAYWSQAESKR